MEIDFTKALVASFAGEENIMPKALANFMFREVIEDAHSKYGISQEDIADMCREAVNRAEAFLSLSKKYQLALAIYAYGTENWDEPDKAEV